MKGELLRSKAFGTPTSGSELTIFIKNKNFILFLDNFSEHLKRTVSQNPNQV